MCVCVCVCLYLKSIIPGCFRVIKALYTNYLVSIVQW